jgi:hypothetical protein
VLTVGSALWWLLCLYFYGDYGWDMPQLPRIYPPLLQLAFVVAIFGVWLRWILGTPTNLKPQMVYRLRLLQASLLALLPAGSVIYLCLLMVLIPSLKTVNTQVDQLYQNGEVAAMLGN